MNIEQAIAIFERAMRLRDPALLTPECCEIALSALREKQERENPKPLTLTDLKEREGLPVWYQPDEGNGRWRVVAKVSLDGHVVCFTDSPRVWRDMCGWMAFDHEPAAVLKTDKGQKPQSDNEPCEFEDSGWCTAAGCYTKTKCAARDENGNPKYTWALDLD